MLPQRRGLTVNTQNTKMNTVLKFTCVNGNALIGASEITCLPSGNWSAPFPICESEYIKFIADWKKKKHLCVFFASLYNGNYVNFTHTHVFKLIIDHVRETSILQFCVLCFWSGSGSDCSSLYSDVTSTLASVTTYITQLHPIVVTPSKIPKFQNSCSVNEFNSSSSLKCVWVLNHT